MSKFSYEINVGVYRLLAGEFNLDEFEQWVYANEELESVLEPDDYLDLISIGYRQKSSLYESEKILRRYIELQDYYEWCLRQLLSKIIERPTDVHNYIVKCYDLYCDGYDFLDSIGMEYGLSTVVPPSSYDAWTWEELSAEQKVNLIDSFYPDIIDEVNRVFAWLDKNEIVVLGKKGDDRRVHYVDNRS